MDDLSRWQETEEIYSILLTRGEDLKWRASLESRNLQHMYLAKGFSLSFQDIDAIRKSVVVQVLNTLVKDGVNFVSCYAFAEIVNRNVWIKIVSLHGLRLPAHRGYPWRLRIHNDSDPREILYSLWRVWRGLTVDHENQHSETRLLDESTHEPTQRARLAVATAPVEEINGIGFIDKYDLSPEAPSIIERLPAVTTPFNIDLVLMNLEKSMPAAREDGVSIESFEIVCDFLNLFRCIFYVRTLQVGPDRASCEYERLGAWKRLVRPAVQTKEYLVTQGNVEEWSIKIDGFGSMESMMNSDFMAAFWARDEFRLCDSVLVQDPTTRLFRRDLELETQCNAPLLDWDISEGPLQLAINTRFNIPEESLENSKVLVSSARPALVRVLAKVEDGINIPSRFRLSTGLVDFSQGALPTGKSQSLYHLVAVIPQKEDGHWDRIRRFKPGIGLFYYHASSTLIILIYALCGTGSMPYLNQRAKPAVPEQKGSSNTIGQSSGPNVFASATSTSNVSPITPNPSVAAPFRPSRLPPPNMEASAKRPGTQASEYPNKNQKKGNGGQYQGGRRRRG